MKDSVLNSLPSQLVAIETETENSGFSMPSERKTGSLLKTLASSKPGGNFLELGTGTGLSTAWILTGMDPESKLDSVDNDEKVLNIARQYLGDDSRVRFHCSPGEDFITDAHQTSFDLIFADAWPGKYNHLDETISLLKIGGFYLIDDMIPQPNWPDGHDKKASDLLDNLNQKNNLSVTRLEWATGIVICTRTS